MDLTGESGSTKAAISLLSLMHQARRAHSTASPTTSTVSSPTSTNPLAHDPLPFEEVLKTHCELPSLHQLTALFDCAACTTATHPEHGRVPPLVVAAMSLLSRSQHGQSRQLGRAELAPSCVRTMDLRAPEQSYGRLGQAAALQPPRSRPEAAPCSAYCPEAPPKTLIPQLWPSRCAGWLDDCCALRLQLAPAAALRHWPRL